MKKKYLKLIGFPSLLLIQTICYSQVPGIEWQKSYGGNGCDHSCSIDLTSDGGSVFTGLTSSTDHGINANNEDFWVVKQNQSGVIEWQTILGNIYFQAARRIQQTADNGYIVAGVCDSEIGSFFNIRVIKLNSTGDIVWEKTFGGSQEEDLQGLIQTADGGFLLSSNTKSNDGDVIGNHGGSDCWLLKLNSTGDIEWQKTYGGSNDERVQNTISSIDGGYVFCGSSKSTNGDVTTNHGDADYWLVKIDSIGEIQWQNTYGGSNEDIAYSLDNAFHGGYIVTGSSNSNPTIERNGISDIWVIKVDSTGLISWNKYLGGSLEDFSYEVKQIHSGYVIAGNSASIDGDLTSNKGDFDCWIVKLNLAGNIEWQKSIGGSNFDVFFDFEITSDYKILLAGFSYSSDGDLTENFGCTDGWIVMLSNENTGGIKINKINSISLYPNPVSNFLHIKNVEVGNLIQIKDMLGREVYSLKAKSEFIEIDLSSFTSTGTYLVTIRDENDEVIKIEKILMK